MIRVSMIKAIQLRHYRIDSDGKEHGWNKKYQKPGPAASNWASWKRVEWADRFFKLTGRRPTYEESNEQEVRYYKKSLPIFKRLLS